MIDIKSITPISERFMRYVKIDTQSDPNSTSQPSTEKQLDLSRLLVKELKELNITQVELDENGYVYATIPSNVEVDLPIVCFCAHVDTSPDVSGKNVKPLLHEKWDGSPIILPDDTNQVITTKAHPYLQERIGDDIITASGNTLLGADDKAGVAIIMHLAEYAQKNPDWKHGEIRLLFTPDEEIGRGVDAINMDKVQADFGYTLDGGQRGDLEGESFSADAAIVTFYGISAHPGYAKNILVNAIKVASHFVDLLPKDSWSPEHTSGMEGFVHPTAIKGIGEAAEVQFIVRDFNTEKLKEHEERLKSIAEEAIKAFPGATYDFKVIEQYRNMKEVLDKHPDVMNYAEEAYIRAGLNVEKKSIRGGTDGSRLSFMGLPCPNIFTGEMGIHSKQEYVSVQDMEKALEVCIHISTIILEKNK